jgi:response regulator of citrate/malate metabolism
MKRKAAANSDLADWCAVLSAPSSAVEKVPEGWHTCIELAEQMGKSRITVGHKLADAVREGRAEVKKFVITTGSVTRPVPHYRLK